MDKSEKIMNKVRQGEDLSKKERESLSQILDKAKEAEGEGGKVDKVMDKVRRGKELTKSDEKTLSWAIDRSKNESVELTEAEYYVIHKKTRAPGKVSSRPGLEHKGVKMKEKYKDKKEAEKHAKIFSDKNPVGYKVSKIDESVELTEAKATFKEVNKMTGDLTKFIKKIKERGLEQDVRKINDRGLSQEVNEKVIGPIQSLKKKLNEEVQAKMRKLDANASGKEVNELKKKVQELRKEAEKIDTKAASLQKKVAAAMSKKEAQTGQKTESFRDRVRKYL